MTTVKCPHCGADVTIDIARALDEEGEVFRCQTCRNKFRYCEK